MNQQDEDEVIMDALAGESSLKKIVELLEDLSRRMANIEAAQSGNKYWNTYGSGTTTTPYITTWQDNINTIGGMTTSIDHSTANYNTASNTTKYTYNDGDFSYTYYKENEA